MISGQTYPPKGDELPDMWTASARLVDRAGVERRPRKHKHRRAQGQAVAGGRYWVRTSDLFGVNEARYHCANRPRWSTIAEPIAAVTSVGGSRRGAGSVCLPPSRLVMVTPAAGKPDACGRGSVGRASPCQGEGRGFETRRPLGEGLGGPIHGGVAERRGNGLQIRVHGFKSRLHLGRLAQR